MNMSDALPNVVLLFVVASYVVGLVGIIWGLYIGYLLTRALRKYLRT